jgi:hypothetical protein
MKPGHNHISLSRASHFITRVTPSPGPWFNLFIAIIFSENELILERSAAMRHRLQKDLKDVFFLERERAQCVHSCSACSCTVRVCAQCVFVHSACSSTVRDRLQCVLVHNA